MELAHLVGILDQTPEVEERIREVMTRLNTYKRFLDPVNPDMHGVGSSGTAQMPQGPNAGPCIPAKT